MFKKDVYSLFQLRLSKKTTQGLCRGRTNITHSSRADTAELSRQHYDVTALEHALGGTDAPPTTPNVRRTKVQQGQGQLVPTLDEQWRQHELQHGSPDRRHQQHCAQSSGAATAADSKQRTSRVTFDPIEQAPPPSKRQIVVDLQAISHRPDSNTGHDNDHATFAVPHLAIRSPSPIKNISSDAVTSPAHLIKTFRQNELRQKEVRNLLEDVRELNMLTDHLGE